MLVVQWLIVRMGKSQTRQIKAFGLNRMDLLQREGKYPLPPAASKTIMGVEFAGEIVKLGQEEKSENGDKSKIGDEVLGLAYGVCRVMSSLLAHHFHSR